jgi:nitroreductase
MEFFEVIAARRSVREFLPEQIPAATLRKIVAAGIEAPSGGNAQLRHYVVVNDPALLDRICPLNRALTGAPAVIVLVMEPKAMPYGEYWVQDASAAMQNMLLATTALGLAACWIEGGKARWQQPVAELLAVPSHLKVWAMMPVGKPALSPPRPPKPALDDVCYMNRFGGR